MALANDQWYGYVQEVIARLDVRWIECACASLSWTALITYHLEEPYGHLMNSTMQGPEGRVAARGNVTSLLMPWEDILEELHAQCTTETEDMTLLPRSPECLKCMLRVHLRVDRQNMAKVLRQLTVRPFVLLQLLYFLIEHNHEVFRNKGTVQELRQKMQEAVAKLYPTSTSEQLRPPEEQEYHLPNDVVDLIQTSSTTRKRKTLQLVRDKSSTPSDGGAAAGECLWHNRPHAVSPGVSTGAMADPGAARMGAIMQHGKLQVVNYTADPYKGFHAEGEHVPQPQYRR